MTGQHTVVPKVKGLNCPGCGNAIELRSMGRAISVTCPACRRVLDARDPNLKVLEEFFGGQRILPEIPLGKRGNLGGVPYEVIGFQERQVMVEHVAYCWYEYLLFNPSGGYAWLSESDGHWTLSCGTGRAPKVLGLAAFHKGRSFEHFQHYIAEVQHVLGEFYWKVKAGDMVEVDDYIDPPQLLSREKTSKEVSWSLGAYLTPAEVQAAFGLKTALAEPKGIAPNQPSPHIAANALLWKRFALFSAIALALQLWFALTTSTVLKESFAVSPRIESAKTTEPFVIKGNGPLVLQNSTTVDNTWAGFNFTLVEPATGKVWRAEQQVEHYSGYEDGESWSEGSRNGHVLFADVPAGTYQLQIEGEIANDARAAVGAQLRLERGHASWLNWVLLQVLLLLLPLWGWWRAKAFETRRWEDSDHPRSGSDDDDDD